ncbi:hypothetical protein [Nocardia sp. NPDC024068]|uniref:hypothetical protein n=1 Tax=Nocardia sp. NPDC024068 TaxID=3157197 RepID=UPI0033D294E1
MQKIEFGVEISRRSTHAQRAELLLAGVDSADRTGFTRVSAAEAQAALEPRRTSGAMGSARWLVRQRPVLAINSTQCCIVAGQRDFLTAFRAGRDEHVERGPSRLVVPEAGRLERPSNALGGASGGIAIGYFLAIAMAVVPEECGGIGGATGALP